MDCIRRTGHTLRDVTYMFLKSLTPLFPSTAQYNVAKGQTEMQRRRLERVLLSSITNGYLILAA